MPGRLPTTPSSQIAIVGKNGGGLEINHSANVPVLEDDMVLVKNVAVAVNPVDTKMAAPHLVAPGTIAGHDFAGEVVAIGKNVWTAADVKVGDRVCGAVQGLHSLTPNVGAYAQYVGAVDIVLMKVPPYMGWAEAATLGTGMGTLGLALFHSLGVPGYPTAPCPASDSKTVLVYGGSTATGTLAIQLLKLSGLTPITTCSPRNFDLVKSYGASEVFDYNDPECLQKIKTHTRNSLKYVLDCVSEPETMEFCYKSVGRSGGKLTTLEPPPKYLNTRARSVKVDWVLGPALHGKAISWPAPMERDADPEMREFAKKWTKTVQGLFDEGLVKGHPRREMEGGLQGVLKGLDMLRKKEVSGEKLVYLL